MMDTWRTEEDVRAYVQEEDETIRMAKLRYVHSLAILGAFLEGRRGQMSSTGRLGAIDVWTPSSEHGGHEVALAIDGGYNLDDARAQGEYYVADLRWRLDRVEEAERALDEARRARLPPRRRSD
jgi:hypothetical protein